MPCRTSPPSCATRCEREQACTLADLLVRRMPIAFETRDAGRAAARVAAPIVAPALGWDDSAVARALDAYDREAARLFAVETVARTVDRLSPR